MTRKTYEGDRNGEAMLVRADGVTKTFGPKELLKNISMQIDDNDRIGLVGPNGCGKTTFLKMITGDVVPDSGELIIRTNKIVYLSQFPSFENDTTVEDALAADGGEVADKRMLELEAIMTSGELPRGMDWNDISLEYAKLQEEALQQNKSDAERALDHLKTFGIEDRMSGRLDELSGGERAKVMLAKVLARAEKADLIILDEPTNHLDIDAVEWLEGYIADFRGAVLIVSHDRYFLDRTVTQVLEIDGAKMVHYTGNYSQFVDKKALEIERKEKEFQRNNKEREKQARIADEQHRMQWFSSTHKTRMKMLARMEVVDAPDKKKDLTLDIDTAEKSSKNVVMARKMRVMRGKKVLFEDIEFDINAGDKIGLFGPNGSGKSSLVKALMGEIPYRGDVWVAPGAKIGYFEQGHDFLNPEMTSYQQIDDYLEGEARSRARSYLYRLQMTKEDAERPIKTLSGGERARLSLAMLLSMNLNFLVLDEPTNHLDIMARHAVETALAEYKGTFLVVSHDRYLLDSVCSKVAELKAGTFTMFNGSYSQFKGVRKGKDVVEEAEVYKVVSSFTEWNSRKKFTKGDRIVVAPSEKANYQWAIDNGKIRRIPGKERKIITK
ncbi:ABC-F family ATP-binding cassette domain-containing protein [Candidatus Methanomassiliicoccus intestinalis]|uniref:ABC-F family ATP-binding cassette domain-containing protein n=2 Tax=Candidatus Methanomassiliicoccus intestinalis TaxID=1406512 RepID=UPI0037DCE9D1